MIQQPAAPQALIQKGPIRQRLEESGVLGQFRRERIRQVLNLSDAQTQLIANRWARYDGEHAARQREIGELRQRFNEILIGPGTEDEKSARVRPMLDRFLDLRRQQADLRQKFEDDIRQNLSPAQQVRLIVLVDELQKKITELIRERRQQRRDGF
jgi:hypothetical protein